MFVATVLNAVTSYLFGKFSQREISVESEPLAREMPLHQSSVLDLFVELILRRQLHAACGLFGRDVGSVALKLDLDRSELPIEARQVEEWMDASTRAVDLAPAVEWFLCRDLAELRP